MLYLISLIFFLKVKHLNRDYFGSSNMIISQTVSDRADITIDIKLVVLYRLLIGQFAFDLDPC